MVLWVDTGKKICIKIFTPKIEHIIENYEKIHLNVLKVVMHACINNSEIKN